MKVAKLVSVSLTTRVIVEEGTSDEDILIKAQDRLIYKIETEINEHLESIEDDTECPYDEKLDDEDVYTGCINCGNTFIIKESEILVGGNLDKYVVCPLCSATSDLY